MLPVVLEFLSPSAALAETPIPRAARGLIWVIGSMFAAWLAALGLIQIDRVVTAPGRVVSKASIIVVQPLDTAIVRSIEVHEGQQVRSGDLLAQLDFDLGGCRRRRAAIAGRELSSGGFTLAGRGG